MLPNTLSTKLMQHKKINRERSIAKSGNTSLERSITRGNIEFIQDIKER
jgi:hypothetical protein